MAILRGENFVLEIGHVKFFKKFNIFLVLKNLEFYADLKNANLLL